MDSPSTIATASAFFAILALGCWAGAALTWAGVALTRGASAPPWAARLVADVRRGALVLAWVVALVTTLGSLYYSEVVGYIPCKLCWIQRICMYPMAVILGVAALRRDAGVRWYVLPLCAVGAGVAAYHSWLQAYPRVTSFCSADAPCSERHVWELGFVSLPFMALSAFVFVATMVVVARPVPRPVEPGDLPADGPLTEELVP